MTRGDLRGACIALLALLAIPVGCIERQPVDETAALDELGAAGEGNKVPQRAPEDGGVTPMPTAESAPSPPEPRPLVPPTASTSIASPPPDPSIDMDQEAPPPGPASVPGDAVAPAPTAPPQPPIDVSEIDNRGVWLHSDGWAVRGTGGQWEYYASDPHYNAGLWGAPAGSVWIVGTTVSRFSGGEMFTDDTQVPWDDAPDPRAGPSPVIELWGNSDQDIWGWTGTLFVRFDGQNWTEVDSAPALPEPAWTLDTLPVEPPGPVVDADGAPDDIWAVGYTVLPNEGSTAGGGVAVEIFEGVVFHYDGTTWRDVTPRQLGKLASNVTGRRLGEVWVDREARMGGLAPDSGTPP